MTNPFNYADTDLLVQLSGRPDASLAMLAAIIESSHDAIISKDLNGVITSWNRSAQRLFGYTADEAVGRPVTILIPEDRLDEEPDILARIRRGERIDHYETVRVRKDGTRVDISLTVSPIVNRHGMIIGASKVARDITESKHAGAAAASLAAIVESSRDAIISKDLNSIITSWNQGAEAIFGYTASEAIGLPVTMLMPEDRVDEEPGILARIRRGEVVEHYETIRRHKDGRLIEISLTVSPVFDEHGKIIGASKIARDMTHYKLAQKAVREREIMHRLVNAQEAERQRIARDLHDHLGQQMTALRLQIQSLWEQSASDPAIATNIEKMRELASQIDRDIGFLSWELRPTELDDLGLETAVSSFVNEWSAQYGIAAEFHSNLAKSDQQMERLPPEVEINLYRIVQEGLNNTLKHADAKNVSVLLHQRSDHIVLVIEDDGRGFKIGEPVSKSGKRGGLGLIGVHERAAMLKGTLELESSPNKGTTVMVRVPIK